MKLHKWFMVFSAFVTQAAASENTVAAATDSLTVEVEVTGVDVARGGDVIVFVFAEEGFPKQHDKALQSKVMPVNGDTQHFEFNVQQSNLAIKVLHDEDGTGKVSKNWTGVYPSEGLGFSNDQKVTLLGAPTYRNSVVNLNEQSARLQIAILYP
ncbi:DUF2141 domain-containing protein [Vibrio paucivorans]